MSEHSGFDDPFQGRRSTSHERRTGQPWDASYVDGPAPWDLGRPQQAVAEAVAAGFFRGEVLDVGCGTGDNALCIAATGLRVLGVDVAETALAIARRRAAGRSLDLEFTWADAFQLSALDRLFDTVLDSGMFHTLEEDAERHDYAASVASVTRPGGMLYVFCFSDADPANAGPHPVSQVQLRAAFDRTRGWEVRAIEPTRVESRFLDRGAVGWFAPVRRL